MMQDISENGNDLPSDNLWPSSYAHLIDPDLVGTQGVGLLIDQIRNRPSFRQALMLRAATVLRSKLDGISMEDEVDTPVTIDAQDAVVLMDLLLRRIG